MIKIHLNPTFGVEHEPNCPITFEGLAGNLAPITMLLHAATVQI